MPYQPQFMFASPIGEWHEFFAWRPRKLWDGRWIWLRRGWRRCMVVKAHLSPGGGDTFWIYSDY